MERHIRWRMFLVMFIVSASPSFCPSTTMLQCLHLNFPFHVPSWLLNCHGYTNALFCVSNCSKHAAQLHILPYIQYRIECYTPVWASWKKVFPRDSPKNDADGMELHLFSGDERAVSSLFTSIIWQKASRRVTTVKNSLRYAVILTIYIRWDWRLRRAHAPGRITEINYWLEVFTCLIAPNCWAILPLKLPDWVVTLSWVYSVRTGIFSIRKLVFDWCFINFMGFTIINPVFTTFLRQFGFYIFLSALKYDDQMKSTKKYEL